MPSVMRKIVITGGPCAGKTSALAHVRTALEEHGWQVIVIPESATTLIAGGIASWTTSVHIFQTATLELQMAQEEIFARAARELEGDRVVLVCDRGFMDGKAYMTDEGFRRILDEHGLTDEDVFARYDAVYHLECAAKGLHGTYTLKTNATRREDADEAIRVDDRTLEVWQGHPHWSFIGNEEHFHQKAQHLIDAVLADLS